LILLELNDGYDRLTSYMRSSDTRRFVYAPDGRVLGEYGGSAYDVRAEFIWMSPEVGEADIHGGDDGLGGYMPLAVAANDNAGVSQLAYVYASHMGVPIRYTIISWTVSSLATNLRMVTSPDIKPSQIPRRR
jgi:hypothetical protein